MSLNRIASRLSLVALVAAALLSGAPANAAEVKGTVKTETGAPVAQVVVHLASSGAASHDVVTGSGGEFKLDLPEGSYIATVRGFEVDSTPVTVGAQGATVSIALRPARIREDVVVAATRSTTALSTAGVAANVLDTERLDARRTLRLTDVLTEIPGMSVATTGGVGTQSSLFIRGGESRFARVLIDGVPINEPGGFFNFGTLLTPDVERVEVVRGSFGTLYGSDALAGVVSIETAPRTAGRRFRGDVAGGDLGTRSIAGRASDSKGPLGGSIALSRSETDNDGPNADFGSTLAAASVSRKIGADGDVRATFRFNTSEGGTPGATVYGRPDRDARYERDLIIASVAADFRTGAWRHAARVGFKSDDQVSKDPLDSGSYLPASGSLRASFSSSDFTNVLGYRNDTNRVFGTYEARTQAGSNFITAGGDIERESGRLGNVGEPYLSPTRTSYGAFLQDQVAIGSNAFLTLSARAEHNGSTGTTLVPHGSLAWNAVKSGDTDLTLRASAGSGIKAPSFFESYGTSTFALGNPELKPERARTFDAGADLRVSGTLKLSGTYFHQQYLDQIAYTIVTFTPFVGTYENLGETRANGFELEGEWRPSTHARLSANFTRTDSKIVTGTSTDAGLAVGKQLRRRPKNQGSVTGELIFGKATIAATVLSVGERADSDFLGIGIDRNEGYTRVDVRAAFKATKKATLFGAMENATDETYQEVLGYAGLPRRFRVGLTFDSSR